MHNWIPTNNFLHKQGCATSSKCPRCDCHNETAHHIYQCPDKTATNERHKLLEDAIHELTQKGMPKPIINTLEENLSEILVLQTHKQYNKSKSTPTTTTLETALHHQNLIGWELFLRGYISKLWTTVTDNDTHESTNRWCDKLLPIIMQLHRKIWDGRNLHVHGKTIEETRLKAREAIINKVKTLYKHPPKLASRYQSILHIPLEQRLRRSTIQLKEWIHRIAHQQHVSEILFTTLPPGQLTLRDAYKRIGYSTHRNTDYPP